MLLFLLPGSFLLRFDIRMFLALLFQGPPRTSGPTPSSNRALPENLLPQPPRASVGFLGNPRTKYRIDLSRNSNVPPGSKIVSHNSASSSGSGSSSA